MSSSPVSPAVVRVHVESSDGRLQAGGAMQDSDVHMRISGSAAAPLRAPPVCASASGEILPLTATTAAPAGHSPDHVHLQLDRHFERQKSAALGVDASASVGVARSASLIASATANEDNAKQQVRDLVEDATIDQMLIQSSQCEWQWSVTRAYTTLLGMSPVERGKRLIQHGPNHLVSQIRPPWYTFLWRSFAHPFNILLLCLAVAAGATEDWRTFTVLCLMVALAVFMRFHQEMKAAISAESLKARIRQMVRVRRPMTDAERAHALAQSLANRNDESLLLSYVVEEVNYETIVPGDIVELQVGAIVPGDLRLQSTTHLMINQSMLTGESMPVEKKSTAANPAGAPIPAAASAALIVPVKPSSSVSPPGSPASGEGSAVVIVKDGTHGEPSDDNSADFLRRSNLCFMGSIVESGSGIGIVMVTGVRSYLGRNARSLLHTRAPTAFAIGVKRVSYLLMSFMCVMVPLVILISGLVQGDWLQAALFGLSVAVGLTPEMLPMIVNTNLSLGAHVMAKEKAVVKRLEAIQNIGAATVLCTDKTGTLTDDHVAVHSALDSRGVPCDVTFNVAYTIASKQTGFRNVLDAAIVHAGKTRGAPVPPVSLLSELPFDFKRRRMSVCVRVPGDMDAMLMSKGSPEELLAICTHELQLHADSKVPASETVDMKDTAVPETELQRATLAAAAAGSGALSMSAKHGGSFNRPLTADRRAELRTLIDQLASDGLRVLAIAQRVVPMASAASVSISSEREMSLLGFVTFLDPPKQDAKDTLVKLADLGVHVKVLTGDHVLVAKKVCTELGLDVTETLTGEEMLELGVDDGDVAVRARIERTVLFARLNPAQKAFVVGVLRDIGHTVAFLGDGVNDALALREADVGISVDSATNLAKDAADIILTEKSLDVLRAAVVTGRRTHGNTIKYIKMTASSNFGNVVSVLVAACWLPFLPMLPVHLLAQNLLYDISQAAIPWDNMDEEYLRRPKPWSAKSLGWFMACIGPVSSIFDISTFLFSWFVLGIGYDATDDEIKQFQTAWFMVGFLTQTLIVHMIRTERVPFVQSMAAPFVCVMTVVLLAVGLTIACVPAIGEVFSMRRPADIFFPFLFAAVTCYMLFGQLAKIVYMRVRHEWL